MTTHAITVPDLGEGIAEVELVAWHVQVGDSVAEDQILADVMTDKATVEIPSSLAGRVVELGGEVGQVLAVGSLLIRIDAAAGDAAAGSPVRTPQPAPAAPTRSAAVPAAAPAAPVQAAPVAPVPAAAPKSTALQAQPATGGPRPVASPALRARAWELGIDLAAVRPSGSAGRIMQADLDAYVASGVPQAAALRAATSAPRGGAPTRAPTTVYLAPPVTAATPPDETTKIIGLRRKIAERMQESKRRIPHFSYVEEVDVGELEALREHLNARWGETRPRLTLLPFLVHAIVRTVRAHPQVNAHLDDEAGLLTRFGAVHVGIATQTDAGLLVPVLRDAQARDLWSVAAEITRLADAARAGKVVRDELSGSTITITSLGKLGGIVTTPVINRPEVAIVGVNRIVSRPVLRDGAVVARPIMNLSSSFDHRVVDGVLAAEFVQGLRRSLERPATLFVD